MAQLRLKESHPRLRLQRQLRRPFAGPPRSRRGRHWPAAFAHGEGSPRLHRDARGQKTSQKKKQAAGEEKKSCRMVRSWEAFILRSRRFNWLWPPLGKRICSLMHPARKRRLENFKRRRALIGTGCEHGGSVQTVPGASSARRCLLIVIGLCYLNGSKSAFFNQVARWQRGEFLTTESERLTSPVKPWRWWWVQRQPLHSSLARPKKHNNSTSRTRKPPFWIFQHVPKSTELRMQANTQKDHGKGHNFPQPRFWADVNFCWHRETVKGRPKGASHCEFTLLSLYQLENATAFSHALNITQGNRGAPIAMACDALAKIM